MVPWDLVRGALERHDAGEVRRLIAQHPEVRAHVNEPVFSFNSPAIVAFAGDDAVVEVLLEAGADPNRKSEWWAGGFHALYSATGAAAERLIAAGATIDACAAAHLDRLDVLTELMARNPAVAHMRGGDGQTPLHFASSRRIVEALLAAGADIDARDVDHRATPAQWMLDRRRGSGRYELARYLVERGAATDIFLAAALGLTDRARELVRQNPALFDARTGQGEYGEQPPSSYHIYFWTIGPSLSPLAVAAQFDQRETLDAMLAHAPLKACFILACRQGDAATARRLAAGHAELLTSLSTTDHRTLADAAWSGDSRAVALMIELGFDPRVPSHDSGTALHLAAWEGSRESVAAILRHPAARELVLIRDAHHDGTPLDWCYHGSKHGNPGRDHDGVAQLLIEAAAL